MRVGEGKCGVGAQAVDGTGGILQIRGRGEGQGHDIRVEPVALVACFAANGSTY
jgi:hypothetical protein